MTPPPPLHPAAAPANRLAIISLPLAVACAPLGIVLAHLARAELRHTGERGRGLTAAALVLGYLTGGGWLLFWLMMFLSILAEEMAWLRLG